MTREDAIDDLRNHGVAVSDNPGKQRFAGAEFADQVTTHLVLDGNRRIAGGFQLTDRSDVWVAHQKSIIGPVVPWNPDSAGGKRRGTGFCKTLSNRCVVAI